MAVRAVKGTLFSTVAQERDTAVRPHGVDGWEGGGPKDVRLGLGARPSGKALGREEDPTCDDVLNGTILPLINGPVLLGLAPPQLCN